MSRRWAGSRYHVRNPQHPVRLTNGGKGAVRNARDQNLALGWGLHFPFRDFGNGYGELVSIGVAWEGTLIPGKRVLLETSTALLGVDRGGSVKWLRGGTHCCFDNRVPFGHLHPEVTGSSEFNSGLDQAVQPG